MPAKKPAAPAVDPNTPIKLGNIVRDSATGFEGIANIKVEMIDGSTQYALQPRVKVDDKGEGEMKMPEGYLIDVQLLEYVGEGVAGKLKPHPQTPFILGEEVKDTVTGFKGIVIDRVFHLNGCVHLTVVPQVGKDGAAARGSNFDWKRLKRIGKGVSESIKAKAVEPESVGERADTGKTSDETPPARKYGGAPMQSVRSRFS